MKCDSFFIQVLENFEYGFELRFHILISFNQEFRGSANRSLQDLNIIGNVNSIPQCLKDTIISTETVPSKKMKILIIEDIPQIVLLGKTKFLLKKLQDRIFSSAKSVIRVFGGNRDSAPNISLSFFKPISCGQGKIRIIGYPC